MAHVTDAHRVDVNVNFERRSARDIKCAPA
jgi:hypothetical protein